jgi:hypothetical protein
MERLTHALDYVSGGEEEAEATQCILVLSLALAVLL